MKKNLKKILGFGTVLIVMANAISVMADNVDSITGNKEYDEIIEKYYKGVLEQWSINEFIENELCYFP